MAVELSRRDLFRRGSMFDDPSIVRPPGAKKDQFVRLCHNCDLCLTSCPEGIITADDAGRARVDFSRGACTFCGKCADICPTGALDSTGAAEWPWQASIGVSCLSLDGVTCRSCEDACEERAIRFRLMPRGRSEPLLDEDRCTGCGACVGVCPVGAVTVDRPHTQPVEARA